ncbi:selenocysteine-specific translation elongation factor [Gandjariella thermophila]|uniref:Selenocysteine-specific elongation factor n=1 Tax=Gandjariella thermophila TaxID=1931992 RepID=A0A4D4J8L1_9PSEU|nr:selenocysteine-specific translation elongation factor [Gandjariella thermophila]GDY31864.1 selenocysteine-specific translation elongation factor [Gandjariella thermophila]
MHVIATAGHVDHGKSTLVRALTGMEPDRWAEERRRGLTIDLGFAWTRLPGGAEIAFVDVPGHERFVPNMLAGVGPVPAVLFVVAADEGWMPQSTEHLDALHALGVRHGLLAVTRSDLADPEPARAEALRRIARTSLGAVPSVVVSGATGAGLDALRAALADLAGALPAADADADLRLWVDRSFTVGGAGTVVTGTLAAGTLRTGDELVLAASGRRVRVRGLQALGESREVLTPVARAAVNLRGVDRDAVGRGDALLTPGAWLSTSTVDVVVTGGPVGDLPGHLVLHAGSAAVPVRLRPLGPDTARLALARPLPLRVADRVLLRDPGQHRVAGGATVLDVRPPALRRRGAARARAAELADLARGAVEMSRDAAERAARLHVRHRGFVPGAELRAMGLPAPGEPVAGGWQVDAERWAALVHRIGPDVERWQRGHPLEPGVPVEVVRHALDLPDTALVAPLVRAAGLTSAGGRIRTGAAPEQLPPKVARAVDAVTEDLRARPFAAPEAHRLAELGLGHRELAAAVRAGRLVKIAEGVVLLPGAEQRAAATLADLPQPFTLSEARRALGTTRRVAVPLLELLDRRGITVRLPDDTRRLR